MALFLSKMIQSGLVKKTNLTADEIFEAEKAADERTSRRSVGFGLMKVRDRNFGKLIDYNRQAQSVHMLWGERGKFALDVRPYGSRENMRLVFDTEDFRKLLRWV